MLPDFINVLLLLSFDVGLDTIELRFESITLSDYSGPFPSEPYEAEFAKAILIFFAAMVVLG